jgi:hypothetical protein
MAREKVKIPDEFDTLEHIQDFWDTHSTADFQDDLEDVKMELSPAFKKRLELKKLYLILELTNEQINKIENKAKASKIQSKKLISKWILEHI